MTSLLAIIKNCSSSPFLCPVIKQHTLKVLKKYIDTNTNTVQSVIDVIDILEIIGAREDLCDHHWPDSVLLDLESLLERTRVFAGYSGYYVPYNEEDPRSIMIPAEKLMRCFTAVTRSPGYMCKVVQILKRNQNKLQEILQNGNTFNKRWTTELLNYLNSHSSEKCGNIRWISKLLQ